MPINPYEPPKEVNERQLQPGESSADRWRVTFLIVVSVVTLSYLAVTLFGYFMIEPRKNPFGDIAVLVGLVVNVPTAIWWAVWYAARTGRL